MNRKMQKQKAEREREKKKGGVGVLNGKQWLGVFVTVEQIDSCVVS